MSCRVLQCPFGSRTVASTSDMEEISAGCSGHDDDARNSGLGSIVDMKRNLTRRHSVSWASRLANWAIAFFPVIETERYW